MPTDPRLGFLQVLLGPEEGYLASPIRIVRSKAFQERFFEWPKQAEEFLADTRDRTLFADVYFCPTIVKYPERTKANIATSRVLWADLDTCHPDNLLVEPSVVVESSPERWQCYWLLEEPIEAVEAERTNKRIAYYHADEGCDKSGWDLTQVLRFPGTFNHKYLPETHQVKVLVADPKKKYTLDDFHIYPEVGYTSSDVKPFPEQFPTDTADEIIALVRYKLNPMALDLFSKTPKPKTWSTALWQLELFLFGAGLTAEEVFIVAKAAACNKYDRDKRPDSYLWAEVCRAEQFSQGPAHAPAPLVIGSQLDTLRDLRLLTDGEMSWAKSTDSVVEEYIEWGKTVGDAAWQYHQAGAFVILSTLLSGAVRLPTSYGILVPNVWFMLLADTTLTRKTTAMDLAMDMLVEIDSDAVLATDGSIEGLMTSLSMRPRRPGVFLRDEFSGMLEQLTRKDYYAGMLETLTKLYDGKYQKRILRRETLEVRDPVLIFFAGGIRSKILSLLTPEHVNSGFIPRFVFVSAESDVTRHRPIGPPSESTLGDRSSILQRFDDIYRHYQQAAGTPTPGQIVLTKTWDATMTLEAWARYNVFETSMLKAGIDSQMSETLTPSLDRLCKSGLKMSVLLAAASRLEERVVVTEADLVRGFSYSDDLKHHTLEVVANVGKGVDERLMDRIYQNILKRPQASRADIMRSFHLTSRQADNIFRTLEERELIRPVKGGGKGQVFSAVNDQERIVV